MEEYLIIDDQQPDAKKYWDLFQTTGWNLEYKFSIHELAKAIENSWYAVSIYRANDLVGFGRIIADGIHHAFIVDMIIHPDFQGKGIGSLLLNKLVKKCKDNKIRDIQLFAAKDKSEFYEKLGFEKRPQDAPGMQLRYKYE